MNKTGLALFVLTAALFAAQADAGGVARQCEYNSDCIEPLVCLHSNHVCVVQCREDRDCQYDPVGILNRPLGGSCRNMTFERNGSHLVPTDPVNVSRVRVGDAGNSLEDHDVCLLSDSPNWGRSRPPGQTVVPSSVSVEPAQQAAAPVPLADSSEVHVQPPTPNGGIARGVDYPGMDLSNQQTEDDGGAACRQVCVANSQCHAFSWVRPGVQSTNAVCWLKSGVPPSVKNGDVNSGIVQR